LLFRDLTVAILVEHLVGEAEPTGSKRASTPIDQLLAAEILHIRHGHHPHERKTSG
jgi:hypothetical protein